MSLIEQVSGNLFMRKHCAVDAGKVIEGHKHNFDHTTILFKGRVAVKATTPDGRLIEREFVAPTHFLIKAEVTHQITSLEDDTEYWCVYSHRTAQGEVSQEFTGWGDGYV